MGTTSVASYWKLSNGHITDRKPQINLIGTTEVQPFARGFNEQDALDLLSVAFGTTALDSFEAEIQKIVQEEASNRMEDCQAIHDIFAAADQPEPSRPHPLSLAYEDERLLQVDLDGEYEAFDFLRDTWKISPAGHDAIDALRGMWKAKYSSRNFISQAVAAAGFSSSINNLRATIDSDNDPLAPIKFAALREASRIPTDHQAIMTIDPDGHFDPSAWALTEHLGEGARPASWMVDGTRAMTHAAGLTQLDKIIFREAGLTAQGAACLPHEDRTRRAWYTSGGSIRAKYPALIENESIEFASALKTIGMTSAIASDFERRIKADGLQETFEATVRLANALREVTDEDAPQLDLINYNESDDNEVVVDADHPDDLDTIKADGYHLLDDPRDAPDFVTWEQRQPAAFLEELEVIRSCKSLSDLKIWSQAQYGTNPPKRTKAQTSVLWGEHASAKRRLTPAMRPATKKVLARIQSCTASELNKAAKWLNGPDAKALPKTDLSTLWKAYKERRPAKASMDTMTPELPLFDEIPMDLEYYQ